MSFAFLLQAILTAEPAHTGRLCLKSTMETLLRVARECTTSPQRPATAAAAVTCTPASRGQETAQQPTTSSVSPTTASSAPPSQPAAVHALNILRALYRDSRLGEHIVPFIPEGVMIAIEGFSAPLWPVCTLLLLYWYIHVQREECYILEELFYVCLNTCR